MYNPTRRNRNIGTSKQGHGQNNKLTIPQPCLISKTFVERLDKYQKFERTINEHQFVFVIEQTREGSKHACSIKDLEKIIQHIPTVDYGELKFVVLRQPKRKEETLSPVWGRLIYSYEFEDEFKPAIIIEAINYNRKIKWTNKLFVEEQNELERLKADGHRFVQEQRFHIAEYELNNVRNTQLYRTLLHEFGHYVHYLEVVERPTIECETIEDWEARHENYFKIPPVEKETFAHQYATKLKERLIDEHVIPFDPL